MRLETMLLSISTDGKVLLWNRPMATLRYPIKGHMLARPADKGKLQVFAGTSLSVIKG